MEAKNSAEVRNALFKLRSEIERFCNNGWIPYDAWQECDDMIGRALSEPARNCDVGTGSEQAERFEEYCQSRWECREDCPVGKIIGKYDPLRDYCQLLWAQMPYSEEGTEN